MRAGPASTVLIIASDAQLQALRECTVIWVSMLHARRNNARTGVPPAGVIRRRAAGVHCGWWYPRLHGSATALKALAPPGGWKSQLRTVDKQKQGRTGAVS